VEHRSKCLRERRLSDTGVTLDKQRAAHGNREIARRRKALVGEIAVVVQRSCERIRAREGGRGQVPFG